MRSRAGRLRRGRLRWHLLGLEDSGELSFGEVDLPGECGHGAVVGEVVASPGQQVANRLGVGGLAGQEGGELRLTAGALQGDDS